MVSGMVSGMVCGMVCKGCDMIWYYGTVWYVSGIARIATHKLYSSYILLKGIRVKWVVMFVELSH